MNRLYIKSIGLLLLLAIGVKIHAQDTTKIVKPFTRYTTLSLTDRNKALQIIDTSYNRFELFQPQYQNLLLFQDLGNAGSSVRSLFFESTRNIGFNYLENPWHLYALQSEDAKYYNTRTPYTDISYAQGSEELLFLKLKHSQNINPRLNVGIDYQRLTSQGFLLRQYTSHYNFQAHTNYTSKNKRYQLFANYTFNKVLQEESGGIANDSIYEILTGNNRAVFTRLPEAQSRHRNRQAFVKQYYYFGNKQFVYKENDTLHDFVSSSFLSHTIKAEESNFIFENNGSRDTLLLPNQYYDVGTNSYDSAYIGKITNTVQYSIFQSKPQELKDSIQRLLSFALSHELISAGQIQYRRNFQNIIATANLEHINAKNYTTSYLAKGEFVVAGFNAGDVKLQGFLKFRTPFFDVQVNGLQHRFTPDYAFLRFKSNQFIWYNNFGKTNIAKVGGVITTRKLRHNVHLQVNQYAIQNWVYASENGTPQQQTSPEWLTSVRLSKTFQAWKFYFEHEVFYQHTNSSVIRIPELGGMVRYYVAVRLFKVMNLQLGANVFYQSRYYANAYNPATRYFYIQNNIQVGNYPVLEPFAVAEVKRALLFAKYEHANQDWIREGYYYTPHYPISLRTFRFGIRWRFYN